MKTLGALTLLALIPVAALRAADQPPIKPNILHIHADDHRPDGLHALGNPLLQTPNLDSLVGRGMTFTHCYTMGSMTGAVCTPSRTMMLTGRSWLRIPKAPAAAPNAGDPATFLPRVIAAAGYQTWHMGKSGNGFPAGLKEFETSVIDDARGDTPGSDRAHCSQRLADRTIGFLKSRATSHEARPFYIYIAPSVPHDPRSAEPRFHKLYDPARIPLSPAFMPQHPFDNGEMSVRDEKLAPWPRTPEDTKQQNADYYSCITGLDHHIGRIFAELKASGQLDNTIIIFSGDNGLSMGDHGLFGKQNLYEFGGMHVPLVIAGPGIPRSKSDALVYLMDLFPTFAEFTGAEIPAGVEGKSLVPLLSGKQTKVRDLLYTAYRDCQRSIRDDRWKLIRYPLVDRTQLFDLNTDPHESHNLADQPAQAPKVAELTALLKQEMNIFGDTAPLKVANPKPAGWTPPDGKHAAAKKTRKAQAKPNIVVLLVDDMGYGDPGCYNPQSKISTPNIDRLAREGMRFTDAHAPGPLCHPSRYGLMTGRYPFRTDITRWPKEPLIDEDQTTLASILRDQGYRTAMVGKWHLGFRENGYDQPLTGGPVDRGFNSFFGMRASTDIPPYFYIRENRAVTPPTAHIDANHSEGWTPTQGAFWREGGIAPDLELKGVLPKLTDEACAIIGAHGAKRPARRQPLMLYLAYTAPHTPWLPAPEYVGKSGAGMYGDFTMMVDAQIGRVLAALEKAGMMNDTLLVFTSDNGPVWNPADKERFGHDSAGGLRGMKADTWEAGHRMPFIVRWPGRAEAGSVSDQTICFTDLLATFADVCGAKLPAGAGPDSFSFLPVLEGGHPAGRPIRGPIVMQAGSSTAMMIRSGDWKLINQPGSGGFSHPKTIKPGPGEPAGQLYNLRDDLAETNNLYLEHPGIVARLESEMRSIVESGRSR